jgi:MtN3 and saliva related transmembrane protein
MFWSLIGLCAAVLTSSGFLPQLVKGLRTKRLKDVSAAMMLIWVAGTTLWFFYGWHLEDVIIMGANLFTGGTGIAILGLKWKYDKAEDDEKAGGSGRKDGGGES